MNFSATIFDPESSESATLQVEFRYPFDCFFRFRYAHDHFLSRINICYPFTELL